jgi:hypothetical protein
MGSDGRKTIEEQLRLQRILDNQRTEKPPQPVNRGTKGDPNETGPGSMPVKGIARGIGKSPDEQRKAQQLLEASPEYIAEMARRANLFNRK